MFILTFIQIGSTIIVTVFCSVYVKTSIAWVFSGLLSLILDLFIFEILLILIMTILWRVSKSMQCGCFK